jgi:hypothetical protein
MLMTKKMMTNSTPLLVSTECRSQPPNPFLRNALSNVSHALTLKMIATIIEKDRRNCGNRYLCLDDEATGA